MRLFIALTAIGTMLGSVGPANASCEKCADGYTFWHSVNLCLADDGSGRQSEPLYWKADRAKEIATLDATTKR